ncbi:unnamed protein product [Mycetohabitans rhizoxinica HKI 454]|uniref:Uncharacterized protein n=1 Tax=Mycetohabitans rhizoxinica (strain DSM 19002 / CIP 109453 / HKI 454) TaxID=882378 RepID=E5AT38_MYCRK|nr:unnamed protein product [Mycetohabitans rhizoxinica HKI 454]
MTKCFKTPTHAFFSLKVHDCKKMIHNIFTANRCNST